MKFVVFSLGCRVNQYEGQSIIKKLISLGFDATDKLEKADCYINTIITKISNILIAGLKAFDFIAWEVMGFSTITIVEGATDIIYFLEGLGL